MGYEYKHEADFVLVPILSSYTLVHEKASRFEQLTKRSISTDGWFIRRLSDSRLIRGHSVLGSKVF